MRTGTQVEVLEGRLANSRYDVRYEVCALLPRYFSFLWSSFRSRFSISGLTPCDRSS
jgi:hypothetical protein